MKHLTSFIFFFLSLFITSAAQPSSGIFKMGLIAYSFKDSVTAQDPYSIKLIDQIKKSSESELYFTPDESMTISKVKNAIQKIIYDNKNKIVFTLIEDGKQNWYAVDSFPGEIYNSDSDTSAAYIELYNATKNSIKLSTLPVDQKSIFGFQCDKVTLYSLDQPGRQEAIVYHTSQVQMAEIMDPISEFIPGASLEKIGFFHGYTLTIGAISFISKKFKKKHFGIDLKKYKKVTGTELELDVIWNLE